jgi:hypothetical protein
MLAFKYGRQLDESDFMSKTEARMPTGQPILPRTLASVLNADTMRFRDDMHDRLLQLQVKVREISGFAELQTCIRKWPGTACAVAAVVDESDASGAVRLVAVYREAYGDQQVLIGKTKVKSTGRAGPLCSFSQDNFRGAVVLDPVIVCSLKYENEALSDRLVEQQLPSLSAEYDRAAKRSPPSADAALAVQTCGALEGLAPTPDCKDAGLQAESASAVVLVTELMANNPGNSAVQAAACRALRGLIPPSRSVLPAMEARNCVELVAAAMRRHASTEEVQEAACVALASMSGALPELQSVIATNGGVEQVVTAMAQFPESFRLQFSACAALAGLAANHPMNQTAIAASRGLEAITMAMQEHEADPSLQQMACGALGNLAANHPNNQTAIASSPCDGIRRIRSAMARHETGLSLQLAAIGAVWCLTKDHPENQAAANALGVADLIARAVHRFGTRPEGRALKPLASGALQAFVPGFSTVLASASSVYTAGALGVPSSRSTAVPVAATGVTARGAQFRWPRPPSTARVQSTPNTARSQNAKAS